MFALLPCQIKPGGGSFADFLVEPPVSKLLPAYPEGRSWDAGFLILER